MGCIQPMLVNDDFEDDTFPSRESSTEGEFEFVEEYSSQLDNETAHPFISVNSHSPHSFGDSHSTSPHTSINSTSPSYANKQHNNSQYDTITDNDHDYLSDSSSDSFLSHALKPKPQLQLNNRYAVFNKHEWQHISDSNIPKPLRKLSIPRINIENNLFELKQLEPYAYINVYELLVDGYIRNTYINKFFLYGIPQCIHKLCTQFYYDEGQHITQISYTLYDYMEKFKYQKVQNKLKQIKGITGNELYQKSKTNLGLTETETNQICNKLLKYGFVYLIGIRKLLAINDYQFHKNDKYLYRFDSNKKEMFTKYKQKQKQIGI